MAHDFQATDGQSELLSAVGNLDHFFESAVIATEYAGAAIIEVASQHGSQRLVSDTKADGSPVSAADRAAHVELARRLSECSPFPLVSEEEPGGVPDFRTIVNAGRVSGHLNQFFWLADPLDGTRDFLAGETTFAVSLALMRVHASGVEPYFGCIVAPALETTWWGSRETPLTKRVHGQEVRIPEGPSSENAPLRILGSRSIPSERLQSIYDFWQVSEITRMGSALKFARIAENSFDVYPRFGPTFEWDTAAGQLLLEITGGGLFSIETGRALRYGKTDWLNGGFLAARSLPLAEQWLPRLAQKSLSI